MGVQLPTETVSSREGLFHPQVREARDTISLTAVARTRTNMLGCLQENAMRMVITKQEQKQVLIDLERNYLLLKGVQGNDLYAMKMRVEFKRELQDLFTCTKELRMEQLPATIRLVSRIKLYLALNP